MKIGFLQYAPITGDKKANLNKIKNLLRGVEADLIVLPEMGMTGYTTETREDLINASESINGNLISELTLVAKEHDLCLIVGFPENIEDNIYNTSVAIGPEGVIAKQQKAHLFMEENGCFEMGTTKPSLFNWKGFNIGIGVCYDYMFPEFWRKIALEGADLFCNTANFVFDYGFKIMQARSIENGVFSITVNRTGEEWGIKYKGGSEIVDNRGNVLVKANDSEEKAYVVEVDLANSRDKQWNRLNNLFKDRREDLY
ncbi:MAG: acyltransferase [Candidatus Pacebacteria bacterium]|nr:acyltransferase [Candidatus Paceibacterota bacterium]